MQSGERRDTVKMGNLLTIAEQVQAFGLGRKTGEIYITNVPPPARINLIDGEVVDAQFGRRSGLAAAIALINLPDPVCEFIVGEKAKRKTIDMPYVQLLCEAALAKDQADAEETKAPAEHFVPSEPSLKITLGGETKTFPLRTGLTRVGRATGNEIVLKDPTISQRHATIEFSRSGIFVKDLGSTNGTYVNGQRIVERWLGAKETVQFGSVSAELIQGAGKNSSIAA